MSHIPNDEFSEGWKKAFEDAEMEPSPHVWTHLDQRLGAKAWVHWRYWLPVLLLFFTVGGVLIYRLSDKYASPPPQSSHKEVAQVLAPLSKEKDNKIEQANKPGVLPLEPESPDAELSVSPQPEAQALEKEGGALSSPSNKSISPTNGEITKDQEKVAMLDAAPPFLATIPEDKGTVHSTSKTESRFSKAVLPEPKPIPDARDSEQIVRTQKTEVALLNGQAYRAYPELLIGLKKALTPEKREINKDAPSRFSLSAAFNYIRFDAGMQASYSQYLDAYVDAHQVNRLSTDAFFNELNESETERFSYALDLKLSYSLARRFWVRGGLEWLQVNSLQLTNAIFTNQENGEWHAFLGNITQNSLANENFVQALMSHPTYQSGRPESLDLSAFNQGSQMEIEKKYTQLNIPLEIGFLLKPEGRLKVGVFTGTAFNLLLKSSYQNPTIDNSTSFNLSDPSVLRKFYMDARLGLNLDYALSPRWSFELEPNYRRALVSLSKNQNFLQVRPQTFALRFGLKYKF